MNLSADYSNHPAFEEHCLEETLLESWLEEFILEINSSKNGDEVKKTIHQVVEKLSFRFARFKPFLELAFQKAHFRFNRENEFRSLRLSNLSMSEGIGDKVQKLAKEGVLMLRFNDADLCDLSKRLEGHLSDLRNKPKSIDAPLVSQIHDERCKELMDNFCNENGIMSILSSLYGFEYGKIGFSIHLSRPNESWYRTFDDIKLEPPRTAQMHYDLEYAIPKGMLYLNNVEIEQGPFGYIPAPPNWDSSGFKLCLAKEIDYAVTDFLCAVGKLRPNEQLYRNEFARKLLSSLPKALRLTAIPGNHILDTNPLSTTLLGAEKKVTGPAGTFCLFTGSDILHRGGIVQNGERIALQICFWPTDEKYFKATPVPKPSKGRKFSNEDFSRLLVNICPKRDIVAVDAGGAVEVQPHWLRLPKVAKTYIFEPHEESFLTLIERQKNNPAYMYNHYLMIALAENNGKRTLYKTNEATGSSLLPPHKDAISNFPENDYFHPITEEQIEVQTLSTALEHLGIKQVDAIKLDTQGTELEILKGLDSHLSKDLLLVEVEVPVIENYEGNSTNLPDVIEYAQDLGLDLFDMRCNRFPGNSVRKGIDFAPTVLNAKWGLPSMGERLNEVDAVFFKDPRKLVDENGSPQKLRRLISLLAVYYFFPEAAFAVDYAHSKGLFPENEKSMILETLQELHNMARQQARIYEKHLNDRNGMNWGQYMHVSSPST